MNKELLNLSENNTIASVQDNSVPDLKRIRITFKNKHTLSIVRGTGTYGYAQGLFEIMPSDPAFLEGTTDTVLGYLNIEQLNYYIKKIGEANERTKM